MTDILQKRLGVTFNLNYLFRWHVGSEKVHLVYQVMDRIVKGQMI